MSETMANRPDSSMPNPAKMHEYNPDRQVDTRSDLAVKLSAEITSRLDMMPGRLANLKEKYDQDPRAAYHDYTSLIADIFRRFIFPYIEMTENQVPVEVPAVTSFILRLQTLVADSLRKDYPTEADVFAERLMNEILNGIEAEYLVVDAWRKMSDERLQCRSFMATPAQDAAGVDSFTYIKAPGETNPAQMRLFCSQVKSILLPDDVPVVAVPATLADGVAQDDDTARGLFPQIRSSERIRGRALVALSKLHNYDQKYTRWAAKNNMPPMMGGILILINSKMLANGESCPMQEGT